MNLINCSTDCEYQKDGKCCLDQSYLASVTGTNPMCAYYSPKKSGCEPKNPEIKELFTDNNL